MKRIFGKRDKSSNNLNVPNDALGRSSSLFSTQSSEYVLPDLNTPPDCNGSEHGHLVASPQRQLPTYANPNAANSKLSFTLPGFKRKRTSPSSDFATPRASTTSSRRSADTEAPPSRASVFSAFGKSPSSHSLPVHKPYENPPQLPPLRTSPLMRPPPITSQTLPNPKTPEMRTSNMVKVFNWGSKPTRTNDAPKLDLKIPSSSSQDALDSFSLKSFRPVRPVSPSPSSSLALDLNLNVDKMASSAVLESPSLTQSPATLAPPSPIGSRPRSRVGSTGSDASQKMTVAQFRQAQLESAKNRSSVHLPVPEHPSDSMPPGNVPLHVSLARPVSPSFALANSVNNGGGVPGMSTGGNGSGNESGGENGANAGTPSRPARLLPPQAMGRSSPIPRNGSPIASGSSPRLRPQLSPQPPMEGSRLSAKWMVSSDSEDSSEDTASDDRSRRSAGRPMRKPPLIGDLRMGTGSGSGSGKNSPQPGQQRTGGAYPSSFASSSSLKAGLSASKSDLGHSSSSTAHPHNPITHSGSTPTTRSRNGSVTLSSSPSQKIKPGQYSGGGGAVEDGRERSSSMLTHKTSQSVDVWSNTHSQTHSRQNSKDQIQPPKGITKSELGHGSPITRSSALQRQGKNDTQAKPSGVARSLSTNVLGSIPIVSSFSRAIPRAAKPVESEADDEEQATTEEEDDAPLSSLVPPRRLGSGYSQGSASPSGSMRNLPLDGSMRNSPLAEGSRSASPRTGGILVSPTVRTASPNFSRPSGTGSSRQGSVNSSTSGTTGDTKTRGRKPLLDFSTSPKSPNSITTNPLTSSPKDIHPSSARQTSLLTPPISEQDSSGASKPSSITKTVIPSHGVPAGREAASAGSSAFLRPASAPVNRGHELLSRPLIRDDSPASSIGNSSIGSGRFPATPRTGSDIGLTSGAGSNSVITSSSGDSSAKNSTGKRNSVTFDDSVQFAPVNVNGKGVQKRIPAAAERAGHARQRSFEDDDVKRNERRRSEAKNAVELGRVVNGPTLVDSDEEADDRLSGGNHSPTQQWNSWQQMQMQQMQQMQAMGMGMNPGTPTGMGSFNMGTPGFNPMMSMNMGNMGAMPNMMNSPQMFNPMMSNGFGMPSGFSMPPVPSMPNMMMGMDPNMMAAHQQAMMMAKQAYQMAVAQQAIQAAGDEWERSSNMGGYSGSTSRPATLFGNPTGSMYGGGSLLGLPNMGGGSLWGGSVYGDAFGPSMQRSPGGGNGNSHAFPSSATEVGDHGRGARKRTLTAPSSALPPAHLRGAGAPPLPPPSSWRPS